MNQGDMELGRHTDNNHAYQCVGQYSFLRLKHKTEAGYLKLDPSQAGKVILDMLGSGSPGRIVIDTADAHGKEIRLREVAVCVDGVTKYAIALISAPYDAPIAQ